MSIRKKLLLPILSLMALALTICAGCMGEMDAEEFLTGKDALNQYVVYYANGGTFDDSNTTTVKQINYAPDSYVIDDFGEVRNISVARPEHVFNGWYYVEMKNGEPVLDGEGNITLTSTPVDFTKKIQKDEKWYIGASWVADVKLEIKLVTSDGGKMTSADGTQYSNGDVLTTRTFPNGVAVMDAVAPVKSNDEYTFTQFFYDEECTERVTANIPQPEDASENPVIYAQYIKGEWSVVRSASDVRNMLFTPGGKNYWVATMLEEKTIDCSNVSLGLRTGEFKAHIEGNGYTIKGLDVKATLSTAGAAYSTFGQFTENTVIRNLTFENLTVSATTSREASVYAVCSSAVGATLENLAFKNVKLNITSGVAIANIPAVGDGHVTDNWLLGGEGTDAAFLAAHTGVTLENATLTMNKKEYPFGNN